MGCQRNYREPSNLLALVVPIPPPHEAQSAAVLVCCGSVRPCHGGREGIGNDRDHQTATSRGTAPFSVHRPPGPDHQSCEPFEYRRFGGLDGLRQTDSMGLHDRSRCFWDQRRLRQRKCRRRRSSEQLGNHSYAERGISVIHNWMYYFERHGHVFSSPLSKTYVSSMVGRAHELSSLQQMA